MNSASTILIRVAVAATTAAVIILGDIVGILNKPVGRGEANGTFFGLLAIALLPTIIYALGIHAPQSARVFGAILIGLSVPAWLVVIVSDDPLRGVFVIPVWFITLITSIIGAIRDATGSSEHRY